MKIINGSNIELTKNWRVLLYGKPTMDAKDEDQLITFLKMLRDEEAYGFEVVPEYT